ncbi:MAG: hypothetical protein ACJAUP_001050 [Cellvibrionaceae bacterium]|jgi:hypothetical protein
MAITEVIAAMDAPSNPSEVIMVKSIDKPLVIIKADFNHR